MNSRILGNTGLDCPPIVYGTSNLGNLYRELSNSERMDLMNGWFNYADGPVMIDSAGKYGAGLALENIGNGLREMGISKNNITISNKLGWFRVRLKTSEPTFEPGVWVNLKYDAVQKISYSGIRECWEQGCELLGGDYIPQLLSVHDPDEYLLAAASKKDREKRLQDIREAYSALFELKEKGEVAAVGIGSKDWLTIQELYNEINFDWVMFANSFTLYRHPKTITDFMKKLSSDGVGIINSAIFNAGFLTGGEYFDYRVVDENIQSDKPLFEWREKFFEVCAKYEVKPAKACLKFAISAPEINALALNTSKLTSMKANWEWLETELPADFWNELKTLKLIDPEYQYL
ncbi:MAG: aldo/keto reductase [Prolixibacteraceae bacterium]|nr:aldo/keto reductase [Prolixibacteraceae bacterium]